MTFDRDCAIQGWPVYDGLVNSKTKGLWTPNALATTVWLDADEASSITIGSGGVSQWNDLSSNAYHLSQSTPVSRPTLTTLAGVTGNYVLFDGTDDFMRNSSGIMTVNNYTAVLLSYNLSVQENKGRFSVVPTPSAGANDWNTGTGVAVTEASSGLRIDQNNSTVAGAIQTQNTHIYSLERESSNLVRVYRDGSLINTWSYSAVSATSSSGYIVGARWTGSPAEFGSNALGFAVWMPFAGTNARQRLEGYIAHRRNLAGRLPSDHPYKNTPPLVE